MYLLLEKQHNRGQDGAGLASIKLDVNPEKDILVERVQMTHMLLRYFLANQPTYKWRIRSTSRISRQCGASKRKTFRYIAELFLGHVRYGTFGKNSIESVHPFLRRKQLDAS